MTTEAQQILIVLAFAALMLWFNIKASDQVTTLISFIVLVGTIATAGFLVLRWVF